MPYFPHTESDIKAMLETIGVSSVDALFDHIPEEIRCRGLDVPTGLSEMDLEAELKRLSELNRTGGNGGPVCFLGAGAYDHYIPPAVDVLASRGEFYSAYTPYQPEMSQGLLQAIYEYQTMIAALCGVDAANASLYDGATALVEGAVAGLAAHARTGRKTIVLDGTIHPNYLETAKTLLAARGVEVVVVVPEEGSFNSNEQKLIEAAAGSDTAAVAVGYPNFFGAVSSFEKIADAAHKNDALLVACSGPFLFGIMESPGALGADVVCGEAQVFGVPIQFGGPYLGYFACRKDQVRRVPGRLTGRTVDSQGRQAFTLTLQAREQHIRRQRATSNICTNQALCAIRAWLHLSCLGTSGLKRANEIALIQTAELRAGIKKIASDGNSIISSVPDYSTGIEFVYETTKSASDALGALHDKGVLGGLDLGKFNESRKNQVLVCVTEKRTSQEIQQYLDALKSIS